MVSSKAATPEAYLAELPPERQALVSKLRDLVNANLPDGYVERMSYGMIGWELPLERYRTHITANGSLMPPCRAEELYGTLPQLHLRLGRADPAPQRRVRRRGQEARHGQELPPL